jgi:hypothetical protein
MLRAALAEFGDADIAPHFAAPPTKAFDAARRLIELYGNGEGPRQSADALAALLARLRRLRFDWERVDVADRLNVAWVLWEGLHPPAEHEAFLCGFLGWLEAPHRRRQAARLAIVWTAAFDPKLASIRVAGDWLAAHKTWLPDPWPRLACDFDIFSSETAARSLADAFLASDETAAQFFARLRLPIRAVRGGLALEILAAAAANIERRLPREPHLASRLCDLAVQDQTLRPDAAMKRAPERAGALRSLLAEALLSPWELKAPPPDVKAATIAFLLRHYDDPRIASRRWARLRCSAVAVMHRWLTEAAVADYFQLAARVKSADKPQRAERRQFWMDRLAQIDDAWLLTSPSAKAVLPDQPAHGRLGGCRPDHVALLLRVGDIIVLEASDATSETAWLAGNPFAPRLFRAADEIYWLGALTRSPDYSSAFGHQDGGTWQQRLAAFLDQRHAA